jgi:hypothetical protein
MAPAKPSTPQGNRGTRRVSESFFVGNDLFSKGTTVRVGHPVIDQYPQFFMEPGLADIEVPE